MNRLNLTKCTKWQRMVYGSYSTSLQSKSSPPSFFYATQRKMNWALENLHLLISLTQSLIPQIVSHIIWIISIFLHNPLDYFQFCFSFVNPFTFYNNKIYFVKLNSSILSGFNRKWSKIYVAFFFLTVHKISFSSSFLQITKFKMK